jgi:hypothetical protein
VEMTYVNPPGVGTLINSGLRYFGAQALLLNPADAADTLTFAVTIQGPVSQDVTVNLEVRPEAANDNLANDGVAYGLMTSSMYKFLSTSAVIPQGKTYAEFQVVFYPPAIDFTKSTILPITATNDAELTTSANYGMLYFHVIGNALAGLYTWDFIRCSTPSCSGGPDGQTFYGRSTVLSPVDPETVLVPTGYFSQPNYIITFDDNNGVLTNFKAVLDPVALAADWDTQGISVATGPTITVSPDHKVITVKYTTLTRNVTDIYTKK